MKNLGIKKIVSALLVSVGLSSVAAQAATAGAALGVTATVTNSCTLSTTNAAFPTSIAQNTGNMFANGFVTSFSVTVNCNNGAAWTLSGLPSTTSAPGSVMGGAPLYTFDAGGVTQIIADPIGTGTGANQVTVYNLVTGAGVPAGVYSLTFPLTVTY